MVSETYSASDLPQWEQKFDPCLTCLPHSTQNLIASEGFGIDDTICGGTSAIDVTAAGSFQVMARIPPMIPRTIPIPSPPPPITLIIEKIMITIPQVSCFAGFDLSFAAAMVMMIPKTRPTAS